MNCLTWAPYTPAFSEGPVHLVGDIVNTTLPADCVVDEPDMRNHCLGVLSNLQIDPERAVMMLTAVDQCRATYLKVADDESDLELFAFCTVGLGNAISISCNNIWREPILTGEEPDQVRPFGTVNIVVVLNRRLSTSALCELSCLVSSVKSYALSRIEGILPDGALATGTDCMTVASELTDSRPLRYAGFGTCVGNMAKRAVFNIITSAGTRWTMRLS